jgi:transposase-like protein
MSERKKLKMVEAIESGMAAERARAGGASASSAAAPIAAPDPEVRTIARRRSFTAAYKLSVLAEADRAKGAGEIGALLRREGLYSSHLTSWRRERDAGALQALGHRRGRKAKMTQEARRVAALEAKNARLERELEQARLIVEVQKKLCTLLGIPAAASEPTGSDS